MEPTRTSGRTDDTRATMRHDAATSSPWLGPLTGQAVAALCLAYAIVLAAGLATLPSPDQQIQDPWFTLMELLIICIAPMMVAYTAALHSWVPPRGKASALLSVVFMSMCAVVTCSIHFAVLFLSREPAFTAPVWTRQVFSFTWPSLAYALDILAWDVFFPLSALFAALSIRGPGRSRLVRRLLFASAGVAFVGLLGVPLANMNVRNVGILGYAVLFPVAAALSVSLLRAEGGQHAV